MTVTAVVPIKYLGSKRRLVGVIGTMFTATGGGRALDLFTGTTRVAQELKRRGGKVTLRVTPGRDAPKSKRATLNGHRVKSLRASKRKFRVVVRDAAGETWKFNLRR